MYNSRPKNSGIYYVKDNIESLHFKIVFRSINTILRLPKYNFHTNPTAEQRTNVKETDENVALEDCTTLKWQQKVLSPTERELYREERNCLTDQQRKYHAMLKESERERVASRERKHSRKKRHRKELKAAAEEQIEAIKESNFLFTYVNDDQFEPIENEKYARRQEEATTLYEVMYVYAALEPDTQLLLLKWFKEEKLLYVYPDFNDYQNHPYYIELDTDYRHLYAYGIEDISLKAISDKHVTEDFLYLPELTAHWRCEDELAQMFAMPPKRTQRCAILFALNEVAGYEYDNLHVRYTVKLPPHTIIEEGLLESSSHSVSPSSNLNSYHIGWSWQLTVLCEEQFDPSHTLKIYFEIISIDSWERERLEGYCHYSLRLLKPYCETIRLQCLRPVETFLESLSRYFIGGRHKFDYVRFTSAEAEDITSGQYESATNFHCRYGLRMRNSGNLSLTCQTLTQRNCELLNPCASRTGGMTLDDIMMAYKEARRRLEAVK